ncbi:MAG: pyridoxamine 5'-phosphate oxidase family protein, partial [Anaerolineaceae bacterium]
EVIPQTFTTHYRSAVVFGKMRILTDPAEKQHAMECLAEKYSPGFHAEGLAEIERSWNRFVAAEIDIEHMTGKMASELIEKKE